MKFREMLLMLVIILLTACGPAQTVEETPTPPAGEGVFPRPTVTPAQFGATADPDGYPSLPTPRPTQEGYPAALPTVPVADPYPVVEGFVWMVKPVGLQCEEAQLATLQDAIAELTAANITVSASAVQEFSVCQSCGCPTSAHYRVQIPAADQASAEVLGWQSVQEE